MDRKTALIIRTLGDSQKAIEAKRELLQRQATNTQQILEKLTQEIEDYAAQESWIVEQIAKLGAKGGEDGTG